MSFLFKISSSTNSLIKTKSVQIKIFVIISLLFLVAFQNFRTPLYKEGDPWAYTGSEEFRSNLRDALHITLFLISLLILSRKDIKKLKFNNDLSLTIIIFAIYIFLSVLWSADTMATARKIALFSIYCICVYSIIKITSDRDIIWLTFVFSIVHFTAGIIVEVAFGTFLPWEHDFRFWGTMGPNRSALNLGLLMLSSTSASRILSKNKSILILISITAFIFLFLTKSRTGFATVLFSYITYWLISLDRIRRLAIIYLFTMAFLIIVLVYGGKIIGVVKHYAFLGKPQVDIETLTGRIPLWNECMKFVAKRPIFGYGLGGFWTDKRAKEFIETMNWEATTAHSTYVDVLLDLGYCGLIIYFFVILLALKRSHIRSFPRGRITSAFFFSILILYALDGILESLFVFSPHAYIFIPLIVIGRLATNCNSNEPFLTEDN